MDMINVNREAVYKVSSSHGYLKLDKFGNVISVFIEVNDSPWNKKLREVKRFDIGAYEDFLTYMGINDYYYDIDILALGFWYGEDFKYVPPDYDWLLNRDEDDEADRFSFFPYSGLCYDAELKRTLPIEHTPEGDMIIFFDRWNEIGEIQDWSEFVENLHPDESEEIMKLLNINNPDVTDEELIQAIHDTAKRFGSIYKIALNILDNSVLSYSTYANGEYTKGYFIVLYLVDCISSSIAYTKPLHNRAWFNIEIKDRKEFVNALKNATL